LIDDAASLAVMLERVGYHTERWKRIKRSEVIEEGFLNKEINTRLAPESSLSSASSTDSSNAESGGDGRSRKFKPKAKALPGTEDYTPRRGHSKTTIVSNSESGKKDSTSEKKQRTVLRQSSFSSDKTEGDASSAKRKRVSTTQLSRPSSKPAHSIVISSHLNPLNVLSSYNLNLLETKQRTSAAYYMNEDDMIMIENVMMSPYVFRTNYAVVSGALAEVIVPGMLRAQFSTNNKLLSMELVFDAMGLMQQLDSANGGDVTAQVIPGSLEMALVNCPHEARVVTQASPPYKILHVNQAWTNLTQHPQVEVEGKALLYLLEGAKTPDNDEDFPPLEHVAKLWQLLDHAARGRSTFSTSIHYRKSGNPFVDFMCSYPLTK
jgi:hypothetical protein